MWLKVTPINHNPGVVVTYFLDTIGEVGGIHKPSTLLNVSFSCLVLSDQATQELFGLTAEQRTV